MTRLGGQLPLPQVLVDIFENQKFVHIRILRIGVGPQQDRPHPHHRVIEPRLVGILKNRHHVIGIARLIAQQLLGVEHILLVVLGRTLELHLLHHPQVFSAAGLALQRNIPQRVMCPLVIRIDQQPLQIHLDGKLVVAGVGHGLAAIKEDLRLLSIRFRNVAITFGSFGHNAFLRLPDVRSHANRIGAELNSRI